MNSNISSKTKMVIQTGLFIAIALVVKRFSYMIYVGGAPGIRISFASIFTTFPAILFGPVFGGMAAGISDIISYILNPVEGYIPWLTVTAILAGVMKGILWKIVKNNNPKVLKVICISVFIVCIVVGSASFGITKLMPESQVAHFINRLGKNRDIFTLGLMLTGVIGVLLMIVNIMITNATKDDGMINNYLKLWVTMMISSLTVTIINTFILRSFVPGISSIAFSVYLVPRIIKQIIITTINVYIVSFLYSLYMKAFSK